MLDITCKGNHALCILPFVHACGVHVCSCEGNTCIEMHWHVKSIKDRGALSVLLYHSAFPTEAGSFTEPGAQGFS